MSLEPHPPARLPFALVVADPQGDEDAEVIASLATELRAILEAANRTAVAARTAEPTSRCPACCGVGKALGVCGDCYGVGRIE